MASSDKYEMPLETVLRYALYGCAYSREEYFQRTGKRVTRTVMTWRQACLEAAKEFGTTYIADDEDTGSSYVHKPVTTSPRRVTVPTTATVTTFRPKDTPKPKPKKRKSDLSIDFSSAVAEAIGNEDNES